ncbi:hypothetical protein D9M73_176350 [compost metagenome]
MLGQADVIDIVDGLDQPGPQAEATHEVFQVARRNHHHRLVQAVVGDRQGDLLGQRGVTGVQLRLQFGVAVVAGRCGDGPGSDGRRAGMQARHGLGPIFSGVLFSLGLCEGGV